MEELEVDSQLHTTHSVQCVMTQTKENEHIAVIFKKTHNVWLALPLKSSVDDLLPSEVTEAWIIAVNKEPANTDSTNNQVYTRSSI